MTKITTILLTFSIAAIMFSTATVSMMPAYAQEIAITKTVTPEDIQVLGLGGQETTTVELGITGFGGSTTSEIPLEIILVLDESGSLDNNEFNLIRQFSVDLVNSFEFPPTEVGIVMFASNSRTILQLNPNQQSVVNALNGIGNQGGGTCIPCGLDTARQQFQSIGSPDATQIMIVLTDGNNNAGNLPNAANAAQSVSTVIAVGVGNGVSQSTLNTIASNIPGTQTVFSSATFGGLSALIDSLVETVVTNTSPSQVDLVEITENYIVNHASFSTAPDDTTVLLDGRTQLTWFNVAQHVGNTDDQLADDETFTVSFDVNSNIFGEMIPVNDIVNSAVNYLLPDDSPATSLLPQALINVNGPPDAMDDTFDVDEDSADNILDVINNLDGMDIDINGDALTIISTTDPANGSVSTDGSVVLYTPDAEYSGPDSFDYTISDGSVGGEDTATVTITVIPVNDPPTAVNDTAETDEDTSVDIDVLDNDTDPESDPLTIIGITQGTDGTVSTDGTQVTYAPDTDFNGADSFTYIISDGEFDSTATVNVTINPVNDAPLCSDATIDTDSLWPPNHKFNTVTPSMDATDVDGDALIFTILTVFQDEPVDATGDGDTSPDAVINDDGTVDVRAERSGNENGRVYHISVQVSDGELSCTGTAQVGVPHDKKDTPVDDGANFDSTS